MFTIDQVKDECENEEINQKTNTENNGSSESKFNTKDNKSQEIFLQIIKSPWFERVSMFVIILNCITLGMYKPCEDQPKCTSTRCFILEYIDHAIYAFFVIEMIIKILAMGFIGRNTYLAESWNRLDFLIILAEYVRNY
jgi:voltage-dependent calcium channel T type alpha-1G